MKRLGNFIFWASWPALWAYLRIGSRTRVVIKVGDEILLLRPFLGTGSWGLPGGGLHRKEDPTLGAIREVREETGLKLKPNQFKKLGQGTVKQFGLKYKYTCFLVELDKKPNIKHRPIELLDSAWTPVKSITPQLVSADVWQILQQHLGN